MLVIKRNGTKENFDAKKIANAIQKVFVEINEELNPDSYLLFAKEIEKAYFENHLEEIDIESIQDDVEALLMEIGQVKAVREYIRYRDVQKLKREKPWSDNDERQDLILQKYTKKGETKRKFLQRIAFGKPTLEKIFRNREAIWGGRNLYAIGREGNITGSNCYVAIDPQDSLKDIYRADYDIARTYSFGGGQGLNLSNLRPKGAKVNNSSNTTPGLMVFAEKYSHTTLNTQQESRRGALMLVLNITHPDAIEFITAKLDLNKINGANISLAVTDDFMKAYEADEDWTMSFETPYEIIEKTIKARDLMKLISYSAHTMGDPGLIFIDKMNDYHLLSEYKEVVFTATNPCGEQPLMANGSCNLGSINLNAFVRKEFSKEAYFDYDRFKEVVKEMIWGLDDLLTMLGDRHALEGQREHVIDWREVGLGVMGLADLALTMRLGYGTPAFLEHLDKIMSVMANTAAQASAEYAAKFGVFPKYDYDLISSSKFFKDVYTDETKEIIKKNGLRNSRLLSIAPTGSISNILGVSGGVEPYFMLGYQRTIKSMFEEERNIWVYEKTPQKMMNYFGLEDLNDLPTWAQVTSQNIKFIDRANVQSTIQKYVDTAISSTFNLSNEATTQDVEDIYLTGWKKGFKGATVFRDNCKKIGILTGGGEHFDKHPAEKPEVIVTEKWYNKANNTINEFLTHIKITDTSYAVEKHEKEMCPICGSHLVKEAGCTRCANRDCIYEKCAI